MRHCIRALLIVALVVTGTLAHTMQAPPPAQAGIIPDLSPCQFIPNDTLKKVCKLGDPTNVIPGIPGFHIPGLPTPGGILNQAAQDTVDLFVGEIVNLENTAVAWLLARVIAAAYAANENIYSLKWWVAQYAFSFGIGVILALFVWVYKLTEAGKDGDMGQVFRSSGYFAAYFYGGMVFPIALAISLFVADDVVAPAELKAVGLTGSSTSLKHLLDQYTNQAGNSYLPSMLSALVLLIGLVGGAILFFQLLYRKFMLYLMPPVTVLTFSVRDSGPWAYGMSWRCVRQIIALVVFKIIYVTVIIFALLAADTGSQSAIPLIEVAALLGFSPMIVWGCYKIICGDGMSAQYIGRGLRRHGPAIGSWLFKRATTKAVTGGVV